MTLLGKINLLQNSVTFMLLVAQLKSGLPFAVCLQKTLSSDGHQAECLEK
jgi:hypothetical protein